MLSRSAWLAAALASLCACVTPTVVKPAGKPELVLSELARGLGSEVVEVDAGNGEKLRGLYVPAAEGAPLVLHFLSSQASVTTGQEFAGLVFDIDALFAEFRSLGCASLALDYRGVGASDGECDSRHLPEDALVAWNEALRRVNGEPSRVIVRGMSIGTLAAASLLERGLRPSAVTLIAPVRAETIARNYLAHYRSSFVAACASPFLRRPLDTHLLEALEGCVDPLLLVFAGTQDDFLPERERALVERAVLQAGGRFFARDLDHVDLVHAGYEPFEDEIVLYDRSFAGHFAEAVRRRDDAGVMRCTLPGLFDDDESGPTDEPPR